MNCKTNRNISYAFGILLTAFSLFSCEKEKQEEENKVTPEVNEYKITLEKESDFYTVEVPETAKAGEEVNVTVTPVENVLIDDVQYNRKSATAISDTEYTFTMPEKDVTIRVKTSSTVTVEESSYFKGKADKEIAKAGETVTVAFTALYIDDIVSGATVNGNIECKLEGADLGEYIYSFEMPEGPAVVTGHLLNDYHIIERKWDEHSVIVMLDCINHQGTEKEFCSQVEGKLVHFIYKWDIGYDVECKITGLETGTDYTNIIFWSLAEDNLLYQDCWAFEMPGENVVIETTSNEQDTYTEQSFTGLYHGYEMTLGENRLITSDTPSLQAELRESAAYLVTSNDGNAYDFSGLYTITDGHISYDPENCRGDYALSGMLLPEDFAFIIVDDLIDNKADNRKYYLAGKKDFSYACATDTEYATRFLVEACCDGSRTWYFVEKDTKSIKVATAEFKTGASIAEDCEAIISINGKPHFKYTYQSGNAPVFTYCGKEAGTYTSDKSETLTLDGFGSAIYSGTEGTYTIEAGVVTFTDGEGNKIRFNINTNTLTFTIIVDATGITLDPVYSTTTAWIYVESGDPYQGGHVVVRFDSDYSGNYKEGYALIKITYMDTGREKEMIGASCPYFIDEATRTVTISNVLQGKSGSYGTEKKDIVFNISDDGKTLTFAAEAIHSTSSPYIFCYGGEYSPIVSEGAAQ